MKLSRLLLVSAVAVAWALRPPHVSAHDHWDQNADQHGEEAHDQEEAPGTGDPQKEAERTEIRGKLDKLRALERKVHEVSQSLHKGDDKMKAAAKAELRQVLAEMFDEKIAFETAMIARMEKHAAEAKARLAKRKANRDKAIDARLARMSGEPDDFD